MYIFYSIWYASNQSLKSESSTEPLLCRFIKWTRITGNPSNPAEFLDNKRILRQFDRAHSYATASSYLPAVWNFQVGCRVVSPTRETLNWLTHATGDVERRRGPPSEAPLDISECALDHAAWDGRGTLIHSALALRESDRVEIAAPFDNPKINERPADPVATLKRSLITSIDLTRWSTILTCIRQLINRYRTAKEVSFRWCQPVIKVRRQLPIRLHILDFCRETERRRKKVLPIERGTTYHSIYVTKRKAREKKRGEEGGRDSGDSRVWSVRGMHRRAIYLTCPAGEEDIGSKRTFFGSLLQYICIYTAFEVHEEPLTFRSPPRIGHPEAAERVRPDSLSLSREAGSARERLRSRSPRPTAPHCTAVLHPDRTCGPASLLGPLAGPRCPTNSPRTVSLVPPPSAPSPSDITFFRSFLPFSLIARSFASLRLARCRH